MQIEIKKTNRSRLASVDMNDLVFGRVFSDHMLVADFIDGEWQKVSIVPFGKMELSPSISGLHHGQSIFEGMKAYKGEDDRVLLFRPEENFKRMNRSAERMCMPVIPREIFIDGLIRLIDLDRNWVPKGEGKSLYIRPIYFAIDEAIGVKPSEDYRLVIFTSPVGAYYPEPVKVKVERKYVRSSEGGVGFAKAAGNYGAAMLPTRIAQDKGYNQVIWTDAKEHKYVEESGSMNLMFVINGTLITPSLSESKLAGVTRDSILKLARRWNIPAEEKDIEIEEVIKAGNDGTLEEAFGCGTAANIAHIDRINFEGKDYILPPVPQRKISNKIGNYLEDLKKGKIVDELGWTVKV